LLQQRGMVKETTKIILTSGQRFADEDLDRIEIRGRLIELFDFKLQKPFILDDLEKSLLEISTR
jgi:hypothetical protein